MIQKDLIHVVCAGVFLIGRCCHHTAWRDTHGHCTQYIMPHPVHSVQECTLINAMYLFLKKNAALSNSQNATYHKVQYFVFLLAFQRYVDWHMQNCNFAVVLYGCATWFVTLMEEHRLRVFENTVLREYLDQRGRKWQRDGEDCVQSNSPN
jgi:hypothetical protein